MNLGELKHGDDDELAALKARICASLGSPPRPLPSRPRLAIEAAAPAAGIAAAILAALAVLSLAGTRPVGTADPGVIETALTGTLPRSQEVYVWITGMRPPAQGVAR